MIQSKKTEYDAIIIGAGIGGLVCGCYLAKTGMKVLIVEKNDKPGGYCTSFERKGYRFDACVHSLGSYRRNGILRKILEDLEVDKKIKIIRFNPSDVIVTPDRKIEINNDLTETIQDFQKNFPQQSKQIEIFFKEITKPDFSSLFIKLRDKSFSDFLNQYFTDDKLKAIFSILLLGNAGLPASLISASIASMVLREYILDGGYYLQEGMQSLPDILATKFKELGGKIFLSHLVNEIRFKNGKIEGIITNKGQFISAKYIVSDCDARQTFLSLLSDGSISKKSISQTKIKRMQPSLSAFLVYLGLKKEFKEISKGIHNLWVLSSYDIEKAYLSIKQGNINCENLFSACFLRSMNGTISKQDKKNSMCLFVDAPFRTKEYWDKNKHIWSNVLIRKVETIFPKLSDYILVKDIATPQTLQDYTFNYKGSMYGWSSLPSQFARFGMAQKTFIDGLYLTGHWATLGHGIPMVAFLGYDVSKLILKKQNIK